MRLVIPIIVALTLTATFAHANHIDFIQDDSDLSNNGGVATNATFSLSTGGAAVMNTQIGEPADILGGTRAVTLLQDGFGGTISATKAAGTDFIDVVAGNVATGILTLDYAAFENSDFDTNWDAIAIEFALLDNIVGDGELDVFLTVESSAGTGTATSGRLEDSVNGNAFTFFFNFSDPAFASVDFSDVDRVTAVFDTAILGTDFRIGSITRESLVPEPAAIVLVLGGVSVVLLGRRRISKR